MTTEKILHICQKKDWEQAQAAGEYTPPSILSEGFIHFSRTEQVAKVLNAFYRDLPDLILLHTNTDNIVPELKWEDTDGDVFPHVYGPLNLDAVFRIEELKPLESGLYKYPL